MAEYPQYEENGQEKLFFPNIWRSIENQEVVGIDCFNPDAQLNPTENLIVLKLTAQEFTQIFSALYNGAIQTYPETFMQLIVNFLKGLHCPPILEEEECFDYPTYASFMQYEPENPYIEPDLIPEGYLIPPFVVNGLNGVDYPDYQEFDVISPFGAFEFLGNWFEILDGFLPQITVMVQGAGKVYVKLLTIFNGGMACITLDAPPNLVDIFGGIVTGADNILDLNLDTFSIPPETAQEVIYELDVVGSGIHTIYITFLPVVDDAAIPLRYGGGFRGVTLCNFTEQPEMGIQNIRFDVGSCELQVLEGGEWTMVEGFENFGDCFGGGGGGGGGLAALKTLVHAQNIGTAKNTTSTSFVAVGDSAFEYTPEHNNMLIVCHGALLSNSLSNGFTYTEIWFDGGQGINSAPAQNFGTTARPLAAAGRFNNVANITANLELAFRVGSGTGTVAALTGLVWTIIEYDSIEDLYVEDVRYLDGVLQKKIAGIWLNVLDLEALLSPISAAAANAQNTANSAVSTNAMQQSQINSIITTNNTQNTRLTALEGDMNQAQTDINSVESAVTGAIVVNISQNNQIADIYTRLGKLDFGGAWATDQNYDNSPYFWIAGQGSYSAGNGWESSVGELNINMTDIRLYENQVTHVFLRVWMLGATGSISAQVQGENIGSLRYKGIGTISDGWLRVPNSTGNNFQIQIYAESNFYLRGAYFLGRGANNPFA